MFKNDDAKKLTLEVGPSTSSYRNRILAFAINLL